MSQAPIEDRDRGDGELVEERSWLYNHIGRLAGVVIGIIFFAFVAFLAAVGYTPALGLLIVLVAGVAMIALGTQLRGGAH